MRSKLKFACSYTCVRLDKEISFTATGAYKTLEGNGNSGMNCSVCVSEDQSKLFSQTDEKTITIWSITEPTSKSRVVYGIYKLWAAEEFMVETE